MMRIYQDFFTLLKRTRNAANLLKHIILCVSLSGDATVQRKLYMSQEKKVM